MVSMPSNCRRCESELEPRRPIGDLCKECIREIHRLGEEVRSGGGE